MQRRKLLVQGRELLLEAVGAARPRPLVTELRLAQLDLPLPHLNLQVIVTELGQQIALAHTLAERHGDAPQPAAATLEGDRALRAVGDMRGHHHGLLDGCARRRHRLVGDLRRTHQRRRQRLLLPRKQASGQRRQHGQGRHPYPHPHRACRHHSCPSLMAWWMRSRPIRPRTTRAPAAIVTAAIA